jgi:uncharacterized protein YqjF (DUF2071 family)
MSDKHQNILEDTSNRLYALPGRPWKYFQQWNNVLLLHWSIPAEALDGLLPEGVVLDTYNGQAWISLAAFGVSRMKLKQIIIPFASDFEEINLRTYVVADSKPGIYLLSVETDKLLVALLARVFTGIPYVKSTIVRLDDRLYANLPEKKQGLNLRFGSNGKAVRKDVLDFWLSERHCLYESVGGTLYRFDIHHKEWHLENVKVKMAHLNYRAGDFSTSGVLPERQHYCKKLEVLLWSRVAVKTFESNE